MKITGVSAREIFDSRGYPTLECEIILDDSVPLVASVPTGKSCGPFEALDLRDKDNDRMSGHGVLKAIQILETEIAPALIGRAPDVVEFDLKMIEMDGTPDKSRLGGNTMIAVSMALCKAQAYANELQVYELIAQLCDFESVSLPFPMFNIINGGIHANTGLQIQEFMIVPTGASSFRRSLELSTVVFHTLGELLKKQGKIIGVGDEGGYAVSFAHEREALDMIMEAITFSGVDREGDFVLALDIAASQFYNPSNKTYKWHGQDVTSQEMIQEYVSLASHYPLYSLEDGLGYDDHEGWHTLTETLGEKLQIVGDDLFATNAHRIAEAMEKGLANATIIKPNQIGTVIETLQAIKLCKEHGFNTIVSHRSGETNDTFIVDLAVGTSAGQIKAGGCSRGERMAKYNEMLRIEDNLVLGVFGS
jgi:enolase